MCVFVLETERGSERIGETCEKVVSSEFNEHRILSFTIVTGDDSGSAIDSCQADHVISGSVSCFFLKDDDN